MPRANPEELRYYQHLSGTDKLDLEVGTRTVQVSGYGSTDLLWVSYEPYRDTISLTDDLSLDEPGVYLNDEWHTTDHSLRFDVAEGSAAVHLNRTVRLVKQEQTIELGGWLETRPTLINDGHWTLDHPELDLSQEDWELEREPQLYSVGPESLIFFYRPPTRGTLALGNGSTTYVIPEPDGGYLAAETPHGTSTLKEIAHGLVYALGLLDESLLLLSLKVIGQLPKATPYGFFHRYDRVTLQPIADQEPEVEGNAELALALCKALRKLADLPPQRHISLPHTTELLEALRSIGWLLASKTDRASGWVGLGEGRVEATLLAATALLRILDVTYDPLLHQAVAKMQLALESVSLSPLPAEPQHLRWLEYAIASGDSQLQTDLLETLNLEEDSEYLWLQAIRWGLGLSSNFSRPVDTLLGRAYLRAAQQSVEQVVFSSHGFNSGYRKLQAHSVYLRQWFSYLLPNSDYWWDANLALQPGTVLGALCSGALEALVPTLLKTALYEEGAYLSQSQGEYLNQLSREIWGREKPLLTTDSYWSAWLQQSFSASPYNLGNWAAHLGLLLMPENPTPRFLTADQTYQAQPDDRIYDQGTPTYQSFTSDGLALAEVGGRVIGNLIEPYRVTALRPLNQFNSPLELSYQAKSPSLPLALAADTLLPIDALAATVDQQIAGYSYALAPLATREFLLKSASTPVHLVVEQARWRVPAGTLLRFHTYTTSYA